MAHNEEISIEVDEWAHLGVDEWAQLDSTVTLQESSRCYIHKVPRKLLVAGDDKYEPHTISIGPYHRGKPMEITDEYHKKVYLRSFLLRNKASNIKWADVVNKINEIRDDARKCYSEIIDLDDEEFSRMLILDGCFILELMYKFQEDESNFGEDILLSKTWMVPSIRRDLVLLENQIPMTVLSCLYDLTYSPSPQTSPPNVNGPPSPSPIPSRSLRKKVTKWFSSKSEFQPRSPIIHSRSSTSTQSSSLNRLIISFFDPILPTISEDKRDSDIHGEHLLDLLRNLLLRQSQTSSEDEVGSNPLWEHTTCATDLHEAGVNFKKKDTSDGLLDISFTNGTFEIPPFFFGDSWTVLFPNIIALEQCRHDYNDEITSYATLMDNLIDSHDDVKLFREIGIISGSSKENETIAHAVNNLCKKAIVPKFYYDELCNRVNAYRKTTIPTWRAAFMRKVIHTPWAGVSVLAAVTLLGLTIAQTVFAVLSWVIAKNQK
ncbi:hypothetical protein ACHQM5_007466 [Ranunculus cassubicifolius]